MLHDDRPGIGMPTKLQEQHKACFPTGALLDESAGERLAAWAAGGAPVTPAVTPPTDERATLLTKIGDGSRALGLSDQEKREMWAEHCKGYRQENAPVTNLRALEKAINARADAPAPVGA